MESDIRASLQLQQSSCLPGYEGVFSGVDIFPNSVVPTFIGLLVPGSTIQSYQGRSGV